MPRSANLKGVLLLTMVACVAPLSLAHAQSTTPATPPKADQGQVQDIRDERARTQEQLDRLDRERQQRNGGGRRAEVPPPPPPPPPAPPPPGPLERAADWFFGVIDKCFDCLMPSTPSPQEQIQRAVEERRQERDRQQQQQPSKQEQPKNPQTQPKRSAGSATPLPNQPAGSATPLKHTVPVQKQTSLVPTPNKAGVQFATTARITMPMSVSKLKAQPTKVMATSTVVKPVAVPVRTAPVATRVTAPATVAVKPMPARIPTVNAVIAKPAFATAAISAARPTLR